MLPSRNSVLISATRLIGLLKQLRHRRSAPHGPQPPAEDIRMFCGPNPAKRALLSLSPSAWHTAVAQAPVIQFFNLAGFTYEVTKALNEKGYIVDIVDAAARGIEPARHYDFYLGHAGNTRSILDKLDPGTFVMHYASGGYWKEFNRMSKERYDNFCKRRDIPRVETFVRSLIGTEDGEEYLARRADASFNAGPRTVATFRGVIQNMPLLYLGSYVQRDLLVDDRDFEAGRRNFAYFSGTGGNIQKGMDLIIEAFARMPELNLYIYCKVEDEVSCAYRRELALPNIHYVYHYSAGPLRKKMRALLRRINFTIGAAIDTGPTTAMLGTFGLGLIPVGYIDIEGREEDSVLTEECSIESLMDCAQRASAKPASWCQSASLATLERFERLHQPEVFGRNFHAFLGRLGL